MLLVDEPSIGLEPRYIDMVFEILGDLQRSDGKTIVMVEQNAKKGLEFADIGYVLVAGQRRHGRARPEPCSTTPRSAGCSSGGRALRPVKPLPPRGGGRGPARSDGKVGGWDAVPSPAGGNRLLRAQTRAKSLP